MYEYKTVYCPFNHQHDKSSCEYAHNVQDFRRNPLTQTYKAEICKKWNISSDITSYAQGGCVKNEDCDKCHGWKEFEYHPKFYKTRQCTSGKSCNRPDCGYYHSIKDKRLNSRCTKKSGDNAKSNQPSRWPANNETSGLHLQKQNQNLPCHPPHREKSNPKTIANKMFCKLPGTAHKNNQIVSTKNLNIGFTPSSNRPARSFSKENQQLNLQKGKNPTSVQNHNEDPHFPGQISKKNTFDFSLGRNLRKQSETITSSSDFNIFCLRSDDATTTSSFKFNQFISPVKL